MTLFCLTDDGYKLTGRIDPDGGSTKMLQISGHDAVNLRADGALDEDSVFIIAVLHTEGLLAVDSERIDQLEQREQFPNYLTRFLIDVFFSPELFS